MRNPNSIWGNFSLSSSSVSQPHVTLSNLTATDKWNVMMRERGHHLDGRLTVRYALSTPRLTVGVSGTLDKQTVYIIKVKIRYK